MYQQIDIREEWYKTKKGFEQMNLFYPLFVWTQFFRFSHTLKKSAYMKQTYNNNRRFCFYWYRRSESNRQGVASGGF